MTCYQPSANSKAQGHISPRSRALITSFLQHTPGNFVLGAWLCLTLHFPQGRRWVAGRGAELRLHFPTAALFIYVPFQVECIVCLLTDWATQLSFVSGGLRKVMQKDCSQSKSCNKLGLIFADLLAISGYIIFLGGFIAHKDRCRCLQRVQFVLELTESRCHGSGV